MQSNFFRASGLLLVFNCGGPLSERKVLLTRTLFVSFGKWSAKAKSRLVWPLFAQIARFLATICAKIRTHVLSSNCAAILKINAFFPPLSLDDEEETKR